MVDYPCSGSLTIYMPSATSRTRISCWATRWDETNYDVIIETFLTSSQRNTLFSNITPGIYRELYCYSNDTDILTEDGWYNLKEFVDNKMKLKVATLNPSTDKVEYHYPDKYMSYKYNDDMFHQGGLTIDCLVTPNHRLWVRKHSRNATRKNNGFEFVEAIYAPRPIEYRRDFPYDGIEKDFFILPHYHKEWYAGTNSKQLMIKDVDEKKIPMDLWLEFIGWYLSEGSVSLTTITIAQSKEANPEKCNLIEKMILSFGYKIKTTGKGYQINDTQLAHYLYQFGKCRDKFIPKFLKDCSKRQLFILLTSLVNGDGSYRDNGKIACFDTISRRLADDVNEIALKCGFSSIISHKKNSFGTDVYRVSFAYENHTPTPNEFRDRRNIIDYNGMVYCIEVKNNIIYTRRNGKPCWNGNSVLGKPKFIDGTFRRANTLYLECRGGYGLSGVRQSRSVTVKSASDSFITPNYFNCKLECVRLDS